MCFLGVGGGAGDVSPLCKKRPNESTHVSSQWFMSVYVAEHVVNISEKYDRREDDGGVDDDHDEYDGDEGDKCKDESGDDDVWRSFPVLSFLARHIDVQVVGCQGA